MQDQDLAILVFYYGELVNTLYFKKSLWELVKDQKLLTGFHYEVYDEKDKRIKELESSEIEEQVIGVVEKYVLNKQGLFTTDHRRTPNACLTATGITLAKAGLNPGDPGKYTAEHGHGFRRAFNRLKAPVHSLAQESRLVEKEHQGNHNDAHQPRADHDLDQGHPRVIA